MLFPGQGSQFVGMGKVDYNEYDTVKELYEQANELLGFRLTDVMFEGSEDDLKQTDITQPAVFLYALGKLKINTDEKADGFAGHSLGEITALVAADVLTFEEGLNLVKIRANAMQAACEQSKGTMAAIVGMEDADVEKICVDCTHMVIPANYNCPGQLVISGSEDGIDEAIEKLTEAGAKRAIKLVVGGAFHSPLMSPAKEELAAAIEQYNFQTPKGPVYQNVDGKGSENADDIKEKLIRQLTSPVYWTQTIQNMISDGFDDFTESGGRVLSGFMRRIDRKIPMKNI